MSSTAPRSPPPVTFSRRNDRVKKDLAGNPYTDQDHTNALEAAETAKETALKTAKEDYAHAPAVSNYNNVDIGALQQ